MKVNSLFNYAFTFCLALLLNACGSKDASSANSSEQKTVADILPSKCDAIINDYDKLVTKAVEMAKAGINGEEINKEEQDKVTKEAEALAKKIQDLGYNGLGGQHCYDEFLQIQLKWSQSFMELQQKAIEEAMKKMQQNQ